MIKIIGNEGCSRCLMVKNILISKHIDFTYDLLKDIDSKTREVYMNMATQKGMLNMPFIIKDDELVDLKEVI